MNKVAYEFVKWYWVTGHYDVHWAGYGWYNDKFYRIQTVDETDYDTMTEACPCCKPNGSYDYKECHCEPYPDIHCKLTPLGFIDTIKAICNKYFWSWVHYPYLMWQFRRRTKQ